MQDNINMAIQQYRHALDALRDDIAAKKWERLMMSRQLLEQSSVQLQAALGDSVLTQERQVDLQLLSLLHRRVIRQLNQHMQSVNEGLQCVEKGLNKVRNMSKAVENNFQVSL